MLFRLCHRFCHFRSRILQRLNERPDFISSLLGLGGKRDQNILLRKTESLTDRLHMLLDLAAFQFVQLRGNDNRLVAIGYDPVIHQLIVR